MKEAQALVTTRALQQSDQDVEKRRQLLATIDDNKRKRVELKQSCRKEKAILESTISQLRDSNATESVSEATLDMAREKLAKVRLNLAKRNKMMAQYVRKLDDIPSRIELSQYQKRFVELYDQVAAKHIETKKFFILYNQCDDTRIQLEVELKLLNSIIDNFNM